MEGFLCSEDLFVQKYRFHNTSGSVLCHTNNTKEEILGEIFSALKLEAKDCSVSFENDLYVIKVKLLEQVYRFGDIEGSVFYRESDSVERIFSEIFSALNVNAKDHSVSLVNGVYVVKNLHEAETTFLSWKKNLPEYLKTTKNNRTFSTFEKFRDILHPSVVFSPLFDEKCYYFAIENSKNISETGGVDCMPWVRKVLRVFCTLSGVLGIHGSGIRETKNDVGFSPAGLILDHVESRQIDFQVVKSFIEYIKKHKMSLYSRRFPEYAKELDLYDTAKCRENLLSMLPPPPPEPIVPIDRIALAKLLKELPDSLYAGVAQIIQPEVAVGEEVEIDLCDLPENIVIDLENYCNDTVELEPLIPQIPNAIISVCCFMDIDEIDVVLENKNSKKRQRPSFDEKYPEKERKQNIDYIANLFPEDILAILCCCLTSDAKRKAIVEKLYEDDRVDVEMYQLLKMHKNTDDWKQFLDEMDNKYFD